MHHPCRRALTRVAVTSWPSRSSVCGSAKCHRGGQCTGPSRNFARVTSLDTNMEHPQPCARIQSHTTGAGYQSNLSPQVNDTVTGARRDMDMPSNPPDILALYDWRTFAPNAQLHYIRSEDVTNQRLARLVSRPGPFTIGLDFEWRPTFIARRAENPISLVQVACDDEILLVQVSAMEGELTIHMWSSCEPRRFCQSLNLRIIRFSHQSPDPFRVGKEHESWSWYSVQVVLFNLKRSDVGPVPCF